MAHVRRQKFGLEEQRRGGDQVIRVVDPAVSKAIRARQLARRARNVFADRGDSGACRDRRGSSPRTRCR